MISQAFSIAAAVIFSERSLPDRACACRVARSPQCAGQRFT